MILDSSAVIAILMQEPQFEGLLEKLRADPTPAIGAPTAVECSLVLSSRLGTDARGILARFFSESGITIIPFQEGHYSIAVQAWLQFGKGRHPAGLNFGDCLSYAVARMTGSPLLCIGSDFSRTDLPLA